MSLVADILAGIGFNLNRTIDAASEPSEAECIAWINQTLDWLVQILVENRSELGRTLGTITTVDGTGSYSDFATTMYSVGIMIDDDGDEFSGWVEQTYSRDKLRLTTEAARVNYQPSQTDTPECFYLDGSNNIVFLPTPDDAYSVRIPYYPLTSIAEQNDTIPFLNIFDNLIIEGISTKYLYRTREDVGIEWNWFSFVKKQATRILQLRRRQPVKVF